MESYRNILLDGFDVWFTVFQSVSTKKSLYIWLLSLDEVHTKGQINAF